MKLLHTADLHLGKKIYQFSMIEEQEHILNQILEIAQKEQVEGLLLSGDIYDKPMPTEEAVSLLDQFLVKCKKQQLKVLMISGNHDSSKRLAFGNRLLLEEDIYISPAFTGEIQPITLEDDFGEVNFYLLPFIKPGLVKHYYPHIPPKDSYQWALDTVISHLPLDHEKRNILLCHQFVLGGLTSESEELSVGGLDQISYETFKEFDYVALGHLHQNQKMYGNYICYSGSPLKYSFSEKNHIKAVNMIDLKEKGNLQITTLPLTPLHDLKEVVGTFEEVIKMKNPLLQQSYMSIVLTDEVEIPNGFRRLAIHYPKLMQLTYRNRRTRLLEEGRGIGENPHSAASPIERMKQLYIKQMGKEPEEKQMAYLTKTMEKVWEGEE